jgi:hypothetical protein
MVGILYKAIMEQVIRFIGGPKDGRTRSIVGKLPYRIKVDDLRKTSIKWEGCYEQRHASGEVILYAWVQSVAKRA